MEIFLPIKRIPINVSRLIKAKLYLFVTLLIMISGCKQSTNTYSGRIIQIDYSNIETIRDSSWIKVDNWKFTHFQSLKAGQQNKYSLPTTKTVFDSTDQKVFSTDINSNSIGMYIARNLDEINRSHLKNQKDKFRIINPPLISLRGILKLAKADSSELTVEVPKGYPAKIDILAP